MAEEVTFLIVATLFLGFFILYFVYYFLFRQQKTPSKPRTKKDLLDARVKHFKAESEDDREHEKQKHEKQKQEEKRTNAENEKTTSLKDEFPLKGLDTTIKKKDNHILNEINLSRSIYKSSVKFQQPITNPLSSLQQLYDWVPGYDEFSVASIQYRSVTTEKAYPKTLVCHDMGGGYLEDRFTQGYCSDETYHLHYWNLIDTFIYFSHHFITIPPPCWTNAAHLNGVKSLGTVITEWHEGAAKCQQIFEDLWQVERVVKTLVDMALYYQFDGWLINIENPIEYPSNSLTN